MDGKRSKIRYSRGDIIEFFIKRGIIITFLVTAVIIMIAIFDKNEKGEASIGEFEVIEFDSGWSLTSRSGTKEISLPYEDKFASGSEVYLVKTLPDNISDGMSLTLRASMQDVYVYIDDKLRESYATEQIEGMSYYIPSAYVVTTLNKEDAGKDVKILYRFKSNGIINGISLSYGNNSWFYIIKDNIVVNLIAIMVLVLGIILVIVVLVFDKSLKGYGATGYLGLLMMDVSLWVISESAIRQIIFGRPSLSHIFSYLTVEMIGALACLYFDIVQHKAFHRRYLIVEILVFAQLLINILLDAAGIYEMYQSLIFSHIWTVLCIVLGIVNIITDVVNKRIKSYSITVVGMICFVVMSVIELACFYLNRNRGFGTFICIGLIFLMAATVIQTLHDEIENAKKRENKQAETTIKTIETIAGAIDAKDEYTGGHSERVAFYASRLAREMAADYDMTEEDILRIRYIGLLHDIGKIGVADNVLNKSGRLTDEEFSLMKKHSEIGYEIMRSMGDSIEGLLDGIRYHHERFDGKGYPDGLADAEIPLVARILSLADSYDAMTSNRVYRKRLTDEEVKNELLKCAGTQFDPALTEIFVRLLEQGELKANTIDGCAVDAQGVVRASAMLERKLQIDLLDKKSISNPTHVRMMCYVMKLMEKRGKYYNVLFIRVDEASDDKSEKLWAMINEYMADMISNHDMNIQYDAKTKVIGFLDKSVDDIQQLMDNIQALDDRISIEELKERQ